MTKIPPICPYCFTPAREADSGEVYGPSWDGKTIWVCGRYPECNAYVGAHRDTGEPLGRLANPELRRAKIRAHNVFDPLWKDAVHLYTLPDDEHERHRARRRIRGMARKRAYAWLAAQLEVEEAHIGWMNTGECRRVVELCRDASPALIRQWAKGETT